MRISDWSSDVCSSDLMEGNLGPDPPEPEHPPEMRRQRHVAVPGIGGPEPAPERQAVEPRIGDRNRLHGQRTAGSLDRRDAEQRALERQDVGAVAAGAFRTQNQAVARLEPRQQVVAMARGMPGPALDEDGALQGGEKADDRPDRKGTR